MRIAVLSLTRDRLWSTKHCFQTLRDLAGCEFDHYVLDQGSQDGTLDWLYEEWSAAFGHGGISITELGENIGVSRGINILLGLAMRDATEYDVIVKFDNDCELLVDGTLRACAEVALAGYIASPHIMGLNSPPVVEREAWVAYDIPFSTSNVYKVGIPNIMGGIFMAAPASLYATYRHDESNPIWGMDDAKIVDHWRAQGGEVGYLLDYPANHYLTTNGQAERDPAWFERKVREFHAA